MIKDAKIFQNLEFYDYANHFQYGRLIAFVRENLDPGTFNIKLTI